MRARPAGVLALHLAAAVSLTPGALANPDGAPWGSAAPGGPQSCADCHFDHEPAAASAAVSLRGLPDRLEPGKVYDLVLAFAGAAPAVGFQAAAKSGAAPAGAFAASDDGVETKGAEIRSASPVEAQEGGAVWAMRWRAPDEPGGAVDFYLAVNAGNDDRSPFGDQIHLRSFRVSSP